MATQSWDWIFHTLGWTLAGLGVLIALVALLWDRSRGRMRCPKCWYSMEGTPSAISRPVTCPECGKEISSPRKLSKTRRHWRLLALAAIPVWGASVAYRYDEPGRSGFIAAVPTTVLAVIVSDFDAQDGLTQSLLERMWQEPIAPWDRWLAIGREAAVMMPDDWSAAVKHRSKWPVGRAVRVEIEAQGWMWSQFTDRETTMRFNGDDVYEATSSHRRPSRTHGNWSPPPDWIYLPAPALGENRYTLIFESHSGSRRLVRREVEIVIEGVATIEEVIEPFTDAVMPLQNILQWKLSWNSFSDEWRLTIDAEDFFGERYSTMYSATLKKDGQIIGVAASNPYGSASFSFSPTDPQHRRVIDFENNRLELDGLMVEIIPNLADALEYLDNDMYWNGDLELPLRSLPMVGFDGRAANRYLIQSSDVPLAKAWREGASSDWLEHNAVKQTAPK